MTDSEPDVASELERLRRNIDDVDTVLVKLLNQRARWALEVGDVKNFSAGANCVAHSLVERLFSRALSLVRHFGRIVTGARRT